MAGLCYFRTNCRHTNNWSAKIQQNEVTKTTLLARGFTKLYINQLESYESRTGNPEKKKCLGTTIHDKVSLCHKFVKNLVKKSTIDLDRFYSPVNLYLGKNWNVWFLLSEKWEPTWGSNNIVLWSGFFKE